MRHWLSCRSACLWSEEPRIHYGPGYRVYFGRVGDRIVLLLLGGDKSSQAANIKTAKALWQQYQQE